MPNLTTTYMGVKLANPIIIGACSLTANIEKIRQIEGMGAGALVIRSLFEEEIQLERFKFDEDLHKYDNRNAEMINVSPSIEHAGPKQHLMWVREARKAAKIPVFASLNAVNRESWIEYARLLADTGVDGLECNLYRFPPDPWKPSDEIEDEQVELIHDLAQTVSIPISVKLTPFYTNPMSVIRRLGLAGASGVVLFNRLLEPDVDIDQEKHVRPLNLSHVNDCRLPLRYAGLLCGVSRASLCCSGGISTGDQVVKMLLAGADAVQVVSVLYQYGIPHIRKIRERLESWMTAKGYPSLTDFRGKLSQKNVKGDPWAYTRSQYIKLQMEPERIVNNAPVL